MRGKVIFCLITIISIMFLAGCDNTIVAPTGDAVADDVSILPLEELESALDSVEIEEELPDLVEVDEIAGEEVTDEVEAEEVSDDASTSYEQTAEEIIDAVSSETVTDDGIPIRTFTEGDFVSFSNIKAVDPEGDQITYTFTAPLNANGEWQTKNGDAGEYTTRITASDGSNIIIQDIIIRVREGNEIPVLIVEDEIGLEEGGTVQLTPEVTDADGDSVSISYSGWMTSDTRETGYSDSGVHSVVITASDGKDTVTKTVRIVVGNVNRAPLIDVDSDYVVREGESVKLEVLAADPDGEDVAISYGDPLDSNGEWQTEKGDSGVYTVTVSATDGDLVTSKPVRIIVSTTNNPPELFVTDKLIIVDEGELVEIDAQGSDIDGDLVTISYSGWMATESKQTDYDDAGTHTVVVKATDGKDSVTEEVTVVVNDINRAPEWVWE